MKITQSDAMRVAVAAPCSLSTVLRMMRGQPVRPGIRQRIERAMKRLKIGPVDEPVAAAQPAEVEP